MKLDINQIDISLNVSQHLKKHLDTILTEDKIWHLTMDIQHSIDTQLIELENKQFAHDKIKKEKI